MYRLNSKVSEAYAAELSYHRTALHGAVQDGHTAVVRCLFKVGEKVNKIDEEGQSPLHQAAGAGNTSLLRQLIAAGGKVNI